MTDSSTTPWAGALSASSAASPKMARALLACGMAAGPLFIVAALVQGLTRDGFELNRHPASLLSNGDLGWIQITNFLVTGLLTVAFAVGMRRTLVGGLGGIWGPRLVGIYGLLGMIAAGVFLPDAADGFPPGTPPGQPKSVSWHGLLHFASAGVGFLCLIVGCFVIARRFASLGQRGWAAYSRITGVLFLAGFIGLASGSGHTAAVLAFWFGVVVAWVWVALLAARLRAGVLEATRPTSAE